MQWSVEEHEALLRLLDNVTSRDPSVQRENISRLHHLTHWEAAPYALLDVLCHSNYTSPIRQAAVLILKRLLQTNRSLFEALDVVIVEASLIGALADPLPAVRVGASLVLASIVCRDGLSGEWSTLLQTLYENSHQVRLQCQREGTLEGFSSVAIRLAGLATCARVLCEESGTTFLHLITTSEVACNRWGELLCNLVQATSVAVQHAADVAPTVASVIEAATSCFIDGVFPVDEGSDGVLNGSSEAAADSAQHDVPHHTASLHEACCMLLVQLASRLDDMIILRVTLNYMNAALQWNTFGWSSTAHASAALLPYIFSHLASSDEQAVVLCLDFIISLVQHPIGGPLLMSNFMPQTLEAIFRCAVMSSSLLHDHGMEQTAHILDDETTVRPLVLNQRSAIAAHREEEDLEMDGSDVSDSDMGSCSSEAAMSMRRSLASALDVISCVHRECILANIVPRLVSVLAPASQNRTESPQVVEASLFLFTTVVEKLFESLDAAFVAHVMQSCARALAAESQSPYYLRYQAVRCVARIVSRCVSSAGQLPVIAETISVPATLVLLADVVVNDTNKQVQVEAIHSITTALAASIGSFRRSGIAEYGASFSLVFERLLFAFPSMQLGGRTMMCRCISRVFPIALESPALCDDVTVLRALAVLGTRGQELACSFLPSTSTSASLSSAVEFVSLLNTLVDLVSGSSSAVVTQTIAPLAALGAMALNCCSDRHMPSSPMDVYGGDVVTLVFDILDACCDAVLGEHETLCCTEVSMRGVALLREVMMGTTDGVHAPVVHLCLQFMELQPKETQLRRSCLGFMCSVVRFCNDPAILWRICRLCINEAVCPLHAEDVLSNTFFCLSQIFYRLVFHGSAEAASFFRAVVLERELSALANVLQHRLSLAESQGSIHLKINAFSCAVTLAALHPAAFSLSSDGFASCSFFLDNTPSFISQIKGEIGDQFRILTTLALLLSRESDTPHEQRSRSMVDVCDVVQTFTSSAPPELAAELRRCWKPWMDTHSC